MAQAEWEAMEREVRDLANRVAQLEVYLGLAASRAAAPPAAPGAAAAAFTPPAEASIFPLAGRALLGLAGAYLLRSLAESGYLPPRIGSAAGILYAMAWLVLAARAPAAKRLEAAIHSLTAGLILSPLLWEATLKFHTISPWSAAATLMVFGIFGLAVSWRKNLLIVATIATLAVLGASGALLVASHDVPPFTTVFLTMAAAVELSACLDHWLNERWLAAVAADLSVLLAAWLVTNEHGLPEIYAPISHAWLIGALFALLAIYLASTIVRTLLRGFVFTGFEIAQSVIVFAIVLNGILRLSATDPRLAPALGALVLAGGAGCYLVSFLLLDRLGAPARNFYTYSAFAIVQVLAGTGILLSGSTDAAWYLLAIAAAAAGRFYNRTTLAGHAAVFLLLALAYSGTLTQAVAMLLGSAEWEAARPLVLGMGALATVAVYALTTRTVLPVRIVMAGATALLCAGILAGSLTAAYHYFVGPATNHAYCATLRTAVISSLSLLLAWSAARWKRLELSRLIYPAMILGAYRLVTQDLHQEKAALFLSLLVYGGALTALPRLKSPS